MLSGTGEGHTSGFYEGGAEETRSIKGGKHLE
jgi:hypothetical protein